MGKELIVYEHTFLATIELAPFTMDVETKSATLNRRVDYLFVKEEIQSGKIRPHGIDALYAILTEPDENVIVYKQPYHAVINKEGELRKLKPKEAARALAIPLQKLVKEDKKIDGIIEELADYVCAYIKENPGSQKGLNLFSLI